MESVHFLSFVVLAVVLFNSASAFQCYNCSSLMDPKCGVEWKFSSGSDAYRVECPVNTTHCYKHVTKPHGPHEQVFRGCWQPWENFTGTRPSKCHESGKESLYCFCSDSACNGENTVFASLPEILAGTLLSFIALFY